jgi:LacI family transcriptional regulator, gluconate utilization system Gnt-I transcriptional repressor
MTNPPRIVRPRATGRVTVADVAREAGVSPITVSRALRGDRNVAIDLVERVRQAATALAYVPDPAAQSLASSRSRNVVVLVPLLSNRVFGDLVEAIQDSLLQRGYQTLFGVTHYDPLEEERLLRSYMPLRPAGLVLTGSDHTEGSRILLRGSDVPCVHVMETTPVNGGYSVGFSQFDAGCCVTDHLIMTGRRRIAFGGAQLDPRVMQRAAGYRSRLQDAGLYDASLEMLDPRPSSIALGAEMLDRLMRMEPAVDAVFFCNDDLAQGALLGALRSGVKVPQQVAIAGFNDLEGSDQMLPSLTSVRTPRAQIGRRAAELMLDVLAGVQPPTHCVDLGFELIRRQST